MTAPSLHDCADRWRLLNSFRLLEAARAALDGDEALLGAIQGKAVSRTLLTALGNTARTCSYRELLQFIERRAERRRKTGDDSEAAFWERTARLLKDVVHEEHAALLATCDDAVAGDDAAADRARTYAARAFVEHYAAHALFRHAS